MTRFVEEKGAFGICDWRGCGWEDKDMGGTGTSCNPVIEERGVKEPCVEGRNGHQPSEGGGYSGNGR